MGTRISEESHLRPKPMIEIGSDPILWHIMKYYSFFGFHDFIICCGYKGYMIKEYFADYYLHRSDVTFDFSHENALTIHNNVAEPWRVTLVDTGIKAHTGDRIRSIRRYLDDEAFMLTYGDGVSDIDLHKLIQQHKQSNKIMTISAVQPKGRYGVLELSKDDAVTVASFKEKATEDRTWINAGFMIMPSYTPYAACIASFSGASRTSSSCTCSISRVLLSRSFSKTRIIAILMISAAEPCIGMFIATRSPKPRTL